MKILGCDLSTKSSGLGLIDENENLLDYQLIELKHIKDIDDRTKEMMKCIAEFIAKHKPDVCYTENSWNKQNVETTKKLSEIIGATRYMCILDNCCFNRLLPSAWRAKLGIGGGKREELKQRAIQYVKEKYNIDVNDDVAEGICLALAGNMLNEEMFA